MSNRAETAATAWDGTRSMQGDSQPTYSDPALKPWGPSLHFCLNESEMRGTVRAGIPRIARELRRAQPTRVVIVGHGDYEGSCQLNDALAMRRADTVRRALVASGLRAKVIDIASLGERRPLDFASTSAAHDLNRRVEILVEGAAADGDSIEAQSRLEPHCLPEKRSRTK